MAKAEFKWRGAVIRCEIAPSHHTPETNTDIWVTMRTKSGMLLADLGTRKVANGLVEQELDDIKQCFK